MRTRMTATLLVCSPSASGGRRLRWRQRRRRLDRGHHHRGGHDRGDDPGHPARHDLGRHDRAGRRARRREPAPPNAIAGVHAGQLQTIDTAEAFVDVLYQNGDPTKPDAVKRLEDAGFSGAVVRDQVGTDPDNGLALLRVTPSGWATRTRRPRRSTTRSTRCAAPAPPRPRTSTSATSPARGASGWTSTRATSAARSCS